MSVYTEIKDSKTTFLKRIFCVILVAVMLIPFCRYKVYAVTQHATSQEAIDLIKSCEGFTKYKQWDYSQYSIGYGTACEKWEFPDGITEAEAEQRLLSVVSQFDSYLNEYANNHNIEFTQNQFDALICLCYALGNFFHRDDAQGCALIDIINNGSEKYSFLAIAKAFGEWRVAGGEVLQGLVKRRQLEIQLFLKDRTDPTAEVWRVNTESGLNLREQPDASSAATGYMVYNNIFEITEKKAASDKQVWGKTYYEGKYHWVALEYCSYYVGGPLDIDGIPQQGQVTGVTGSSGSDDPVSVSEVWKITSSDGVRLRSGPGLSYGQIGHVPFNSQITVTSTVSSDGYLWGKTTVNGTSGWCVLDYATRISSQQLAGATLSSIYIASKPTKLTYAEGESLDLTGLKVEALYSDNSKKEVPEDSYTVTGFESKEGKQTVTVTYMKKTANFNVTVTGKQLTKLEIDSAPTKTLYKTGEGLSVKGLKVRGVYSNNTTEVLNEFYLDGVDGFSATAGKKKIAVVVDDLRAEFEVEVTEKTLIGIEIASLPNKTDYIVGQRFDPTGLTLNGIFDNGRTAPIDSYSLTGFTLDKAGEQTITINFNGFSAEFTINVEEPDEYELAGDLNGNGTRDIFDLVILNQLVDGDDQAAGDRYYLADVDYDGSVTQSDVDTLSDIVSQQ